MHWNRSKYASPEEAASKSDGLAVLGMLLKESDDAAHEELQKVIDQLPAIRYKGQRSTFPAEVDPAKLLPAGSKSFWTYPGSLTTPPLLESVTWIVFKEPVLVSKEQVRSMREKVDEAWLLL